MIRRDVNVEFLRTSYTRCNNAGPVSDVLSDGMSLRGLLFIASMIIITTFLCYFRTVQRVFMTFTLSLIEKI